MTDHGPTQQPVAQADLAQRVLDEIGQRRAGYGAHHQRRPGIRYARKSLQCRLHELVERRHDRVGVARQAEKQRIAYASEGQRPSTSLSSLSV